MSLRYLFGPVTPVYAAEKLHEQRQAGACLAFNATGDVDVGIAATDDWQTVLSRLPAGWQPDFVVLNLGYTCVPGCLWSQPLPLVGLAQDWNLLWHLYRRRLRQCDVVLTDTLGVETLHREGIAHARAAILFGCDRSWVAQPWPEVTRDIDVLFVGNFNPAVQRERLPWFARLARLTGGETTPPPAPGTTPPPSPLPEAERGSRKEAAPPGSGEGSRNPLLPLSASGRGLGGGVSSAFLPLSASGRGPGGGVSSAFLPLSASGRGLGGGVRPRRVVLTTGMFGDDYRRLLARARIVFNYSIRGECNLRTFEAAASRALLFQEAGNREVPAYFRDGEECVLYDHTNLEPLVNYYLDHEDKRQTIAAAARARIGEFTFARLWQAQVEQIETDLPALRERATTRYVPTAVESLRTRTWEVLCASLGDDPRLGDDLRMAVSQEPRAELQHALGMIAGMAATANGRMEAATWFQSASRVAKAPPGCEDSTRGYSNPPRGIPEILAALCNPVRGDPMAKASPGCEDSTRGYSNPPPGVPEIMAALCNPVRGDPMVAPGEAPLDPRAATTNMGGTRGCQPLSLLNAAEALADLGQVPQAIDLARQALACLEQTADLSADSLDAAHFPPHFDVFRVEWERAAWENAGRPDAEVAAKRRLLLWRLHCVLAQWTGDLEHFRKAVEARPELWPSLAALGCALGRAGQAAEAVGFLRQAVAGNPLDPAAARALHQALSDARDQAGLELLVQERRQLAAAVPVLAREAWFDDVPVRRVSNPLSSRPAGLELPPTNNDRDGTPSQPDNWWRYELADGQPTTTHAGPTAAASSNWLQTLSRDEFHRRLGTPDTSAALRGFTNADDTRAVLTLLVHARPRRILEIGTAEGHMTANFTQWSDDEAVVFTLGTIDDLPVHTSPAQRYETPGRQHFGRLANAFGKAAKVFFITADSLSYDFRRLDGIDFAFIDGAHDLRHVVSDSLSVYDVLRPGGWLVWHDFTSTVSWVEVRRALERLRFDEPVVHVAGTAVAFLRKADRVDPVGWVESSRPTESVAPAAASPRLESSRPTESVAHAATSPRVESSRPTESVAQASGSPRVESSRPTESVAQAGGSRRLDPPYDNDQPTMRECESGLAIVWEGTQQAVHSFAVVNRQMCSHLLSRGHDLSVLASGFVGLAERGPDGTLPPPGYRVVDGDAVPLSPALAASFYRPLPRPADVHVRHLWPPQFTPPAEGRWVFMQPWEYGSIPKAWVEPLINDVDEIWAYTGYVRACYLAAGIPADRVHVVPLGVDCERFTPQAAPLPLPARKRFKFLFVGGTIQRKGIDVLLDAWARAFTDRDDVCLVIKDMGAGSFYRGQTAEGLIGEHQRRPGAAEIVYRDQSLSDAEMPGLYTACDCLVHPYRGEGFGLPIAEAMACELPVIVTGMGAALDFCDTDNAYLIPARRAPLAEKRLGDLETVDYPWLAEPDVDALAAHLRHVFANPDEARAKGRRGRERILSAFTWHHAALAAESRLLALRDHPVRRSSQSACKPAAQARESHKPDAPARDSPTRPRKSLCIMAKNEEPNLPACLESARDLADEIIVVDTGSTDRTREIAASFGARVVDFPWVDSFAAARNECLRHATGDWIFWLDADDRLDADNRERLRVLLAGLGYENEAWVMKCLCLPGPEGGRGTIVDHVRLFRNLPQLRWDYRVHEQILPALRRANHDVRHSKVVLHHIGYQDPALHRRKLERNWRLLELEHTERPDDPFILFNLGSLSLELGRMDAALTFLRRSLALSHPDHSITRKLYALLSQCHRQLGQKELSLAACLKGREFYPDDVELLFQEGLVRRDAGDRAGARDCWMQVRQPRRTDHFASLDAGLTGYRVLQNLADLELQAGNLPEAEAHWQAALAEQPDFLPARLGLAEVCLRQGRWADLEQSVAALAAIGLVAEGELLRARGHIARGEFEHCYRVLQDVIARSPRSPQPLRILSYALLQEGKNWPAAERVLRDLIALDPSDAEARNNLTVLLRRQG